MHQILFKFPFSGGHPGPPPLGALPQTPGRGGRGEKGRAKRERAGKGKGEGEGKGKEGEGKGRGSLRYCRWGDERPCV